MLVEDVGQYNLQLCGTIHCDIVIVTITSELRPSPPQYGDCYSELWPFVKTMSANKTRIIISSSVIQISPGGEGLRLMFIFSREPKDRC
jgi:hypothetical protein